jgi:MarR family 2-MHQ and catechol resistance regulon transcriptional repressor
MPIRDYKDDPYLSLLRPLVEAYLAFYRVGNRHIQSLGLTPGQFDVIAELEGTKGLTCAQLSEQTLTTKGTLTGVLDRLEHRGLIQRGTVGGDRRATRVQLTSKGIDVLQEVFPVHAEFMRPFFAQALNASEVQVAKRLLRRVRDSFNGPMSVPKVELPRMENSSINLRTSKTSQNPDKKLRLSRKTKVQKN